MSPGVVAQRSPDGKVVRRWVFAVGLVSLGVVLVLAGWRFVWPSEQTPWEYALGPASDFAPGTVTSYMATNDGARLLSEAGDYGPRPSDYPTDGRRVIHVVRLPDGELRVLEGADQYFGWTIVWYPLAESGVVGDYRGLFREPRRGSAWTIDGTPVFGPIHRELDRFAFRIRADGVLVVDLNDTRPGASTTWRPPPYDVTSEGWATSGWPAAVGE